MRLLVDAQCLQSSSAERGIGRFGLCLSEALVATSGRHQVEFLLNGGADPARSLRARQALESLVPGRAVHVFDAPWPWSAPYSDARRPAAEAAYRATVRALGPDALLVLSVFEDDDEAVLGLGRSPGDPPTVAVLHDLMPALDPGTYLLGPSAPRYWRRFEQLGGCQLLLANSEYSAAQAHTAFRGCPPATVAIRGGPYPSGAFPAFESSADEREWTIPDDFVLSVGGDHPRKNLDRLVAAWGLIGSDGRAGRRLVLACRLSTGTVKRLRRVGATYGLRPEDLLFTGAVSEFSLRRLYEAATAFAFVSLDEGLGMPPLEAMSAGCPTILASGSALSELLDDPGLFVDPHDAADIARGLTRILRDGAFREQARAAATRSADRFTWTAAARRAWPALEALPAPAPRGRVYPEPVRLSDGPAVRALQDDPAPVLVDEPIPEGERGRLGFPVTARALLAPATALVVSDLPSAAQVVRAGHLDMPVVLAPSDLIGVVAHDFYRELGTCLAEEPKLSGPMQAQLVASVERPPRWTLERPAPCWLLLASDEAASSLQCSFDASGVHLLVSTGPAAAVAGLVDVVLVEQMLVPRLLPEIAHARVRGAHVVVLATGGAPMPPWSEELVLEGPLSEASTWLPLLPALVARWPKTTGWPWRDAR